MNNHLAIEIQNLLPRSRSKSFKAALKEWFATGEYDEYPSATETCELCGKENLKYHYEIKNQHTEETLNIGSSCILKFEIMILSDGKLELPSNKLLSRIERKFQLRKAYEQMTTLVRSCSETYREYYESLRSKIESDQDLSPKEALNTFKAFYKNRIKYDPSCFRIGLRTSRSKMELMAMDDWSRSKILPAMSSEQKKRYFSNSENDLSNRT